MDKKRLTIELSEQALDNLSIYCHQSGLDPAAVIQAYLLTLNGVQSNVIDRDRNRDICHEASREISRDVMSEHHQPESEPMMQLQKTIKSLKYEKADLEIMLENTLEHSDSITAQLRIAKAAAESASQAKSTFLARMSHELRTPLNAILGFSQLLEKSPSLTPQQREHLTIINRSGKHLLNLINDILDMSKLEASKTKLKPETIDLHALLHNMQAMFSLKAEAKGLQLRLEQSPQLPKYVEMDAGKLRQVLINLLDNAIKFTDRGQVCLTARSQPMVTQQKTDAKASNSRTICTLYFAVQDSGPGIIETDFETIFVPFEQTDVGRNTHQGTGLGLSISQKFIQLMGGQITVSSQIDKGAKFEFHLPVYQHSSLVSPTGFSAYYPVEYSGDLSEHQAEEETLDEMDISAPLTPESPREKMSAMPVQWVSELHHAASQLKRKRVLTLIAQVPEDQVSLARYLRELADNYQFDKIIEITTR